MIESILDVNWIAVGVGTVLAFVLGAVWYSPMMFVKGWAEGVGVDIDNKPDGMAATMITQFLGTFLLAWAIGVTAALNSPGFAGLIVLALAVLIYAGGGYAQKSAYAKWVEAGFVIAMGVVMVACHAVL